MAVPGNPPYAGATYSGTTGVSRPTTVTLAYFGALGAGLLSLLGGILMMAGAHDTATQVAVDALGLGPNDVADPIVQSAIDDAASTLSSRGVISIVVGVLAILIALALRNAATWARVVETLVLLAVVGASVITVRDEAPTATSLLEILAIVVSLVAIVLMFLGPTNRYAARPKSAA